jgi:hypothetical protein
MKYLETFSLFCESINNDIVLLYHGTSQYSEQLLLKNGWEPNKFSSGGQQGNPAYLYLSLTPEMACGYAAEKGNDENVLEVRVPKSYLRVDPHDGMYHGDVDMELKQGVSLICIKPLDSSAFTKYTGTFSVTGSFMDDDY